MSVLIIIRKKTIHNIYIANFNSNSNSSNCVCD